MWVSGEKLQIPRMLDIDWGKDLEYCVDIHTVSILCSSKNAKNTRKPYINKSNFNIYKMYFVFSQTDWPGCCLVLQSTTKATSSTFYNCVDIAYMSESILWLCYYYCIYACVHVNIAYMLTLYTCEHYKPVNNTYMRTLRTCEKA